MVTGRNHSFWWWHGPRTPRPHPNLTSEALGWFKAKFPGMCLQKDPPKSVVCLLFVPVSLVPKSSTFLMSGLRVDAMKITFKGGRDLYPISWWCVWITTSSLFQKFALHPSPCVDLFSFSLCCGCVDLRGPRLPELCVFFARGAAQVAGKPVGLLWCAGIFREPLPLPSLEKMMGEWFRSRRERIVLIATSRF